MVVQELPRFHLPSVISGPEIVRTIKRKGWVGNCPACGEHFLYTKFNNTEPTPFFYCDKQSDVLLRESDQKLVREAYKSRRNSPAELKELWDSFVEKAPSCICGGKFGFWTYIRCPSCQEQLPYPTGPELVSTRIHEPQVIVLDGRYVLRDTPGESYQVIVTLD